MRCSLFFIYKHPLNKLPNALIKARIAAQISQQELADILGIHEQRVKEYEDTDYQCASFVEILEVSTALGVQFEIATVQVDFAEIEAVKKAWTNGAKKN
ncbi:MAG: helix-turn-helix transcriptional regulator [Nostoc sp.]|uniref:helix-turn-helix transcriptional regulator n=1 Tax=Nostoc sp. TaxID=1180 RepID=UPI002FF89C01